MWKVLVLLFALCPAMALAQIQAHVIYEPPDPGLRWGTNLLLGARVTGSPHWSDRKPEFAVDGRHDNAGNHWAAENIPVQLTVQLQKPTALNCLRLWTFWDNRRYYQYVIEGSEDGENWRVLADRRDNMTPATAAGETFVFPTATASQVRVTFTRNSASNAAGGHIVEIEGYELP
ncbi:discoidin domain-containing protein, partial [bacterium]|nr:discoidin domain-containing protein [bacterium]